MSREAGWGKGESSGKHTLKTSPWGVSRVMFSTSRGSAGELFLKLKAQRDLAGDQRVTGTTTSTQMTNSSGGTGEKGMCRRYKGEDSSSYDLFGS